MFFIDTHAHLMAEEFKDDLDSVVKNALENKVRAIINVGYNLESSKQAIEISKKYEQCFSTVGVHPYDSVIITDDFLAKYLSLISEEKVVAIGEIGLDYHKCEVSVDLQKEVFRKQLQIAKENLLPVIIHNRDADLDSFDIIKEFNGVDMVFHCYSGSLDFAKKLLERDIYLSFTSNITFPKADLIRDVAKNIPLDRIMIETDCPWLAPQDFRGQRCEPAYVQYVAKTISEIRGISVEEIAQITSENALRFFKKLKV